jgi:hypothetical protein
MRARSLRQLGRARRGRPGLYGLCRDPLVLASDNARCQRLWGPGVRAEPRPARPVGCICGSDSGARTQRAFPARRRARSFANVGRRYRRYPAGLIHPSGHAIKRKSPGGSSRNWWVALVRRRTRTRSLRPARARIRPMRPSGTRTQSPTWNLAAIKRSLRKKRGCRCLTKCASAASFGLHARTIFTFHFLERRSAPERKPATWRWSAACAG